jgi:23S rRNA (cytidine1920-2'-O)/16S rRNA (cytidine1409-2'-O)-methyltransferase
VPHARRARFVTITERLRRSHPDLTDPAAVIAAGEVQVAGVIVTRPTALVRADASVRIRSTPRPRGAAKLEAALRHFAVPVAGRTALDIGASTGGFTVALLEAGARLVYAVDAGHGQLLGRLRADPRVVNLEGTNIGALGPSPGPLDLVVIDVSYLALADLAPQLTALRLAAPAQLLALVKPMFELHLPRLPVDPSEGTKAVDLALAGFERTGWRARGAMPSPVPGHRGAAEFLIHLTRP